MKKAKAGELIENKADAPVKSANVRTFNVFVDNEYFSVEVDPVGGSVAPMPQVQAATPGPAAISVPAPVAAPAVRTPAAAPAQPSGDVAGTLLLAPMPGMIVKYLKSLGETVAKGETIVILEAMKMENALVAPCDGVLKSIKFKSGDTVAKGASLCVIG